MRQAIEESRDDGRAAYGREATEAAFPLGGIGTGNFSIGCRGELRDWEIFNRPGKGVRLPNTFFAIRACPANGQAVTKVLESKLMPPYHRSHGFHPSSGAGLPRMQSSSMRGEYPFVWLDFEDDRLPVRVSLEAFTPLIPLNVRDSSIPGAVFTYTVANPLDFPVDVTLAGSLANPIGGIRYGQYGQLSSPDMGGNFNDFRTGSGCSGLFMRSERHAPDGLHYGNLALVTTASELTYKRAWVRGSWHDDLEEFWQDFSDDGRLTDLNYAEPTAHYRTDTGSLGAVRTLLPGESAQFRFFLAWHFPNRLNGWSEDVRVTRSGNEVAQNYYVNDYADAWETAEYLVLNFDRLRFETARFHRAVFESELPYPIRDAAMSNVAVVRSTTCFRLKDGRFLGYEGCFDDEGCCPGNCTHVWNYAQTIAFLFPELERDMRRTEFLEEVEADGMMNFRAYKMFENLWQHWADGDAPPAADGQLGSIMRVYRDWKLSGDEPFLRELWPQVKKALHYALLRWDADGDGLLEGKQHVTYDIEFIGPNPLTGVFLLGALKAGAEMASYLDDGETQQRLRQLYETSARLLDQLLWNGTYYAQKLDEVDSHKYQFGSGCLSDQLFAQQLAHLYGLGYLLPEERVKSAIRAVYGFNFRTDFSDHANAQRTYALNDEEGLVLCSWPQGGRPKYPFIYSDEVWTGVEYQVAAHLIYEGFVDEGVALVKAVRDRHDGIKRNPWNEVECGHHYARSMASWGLIIAYSGFQADLARNEMRFSPVAGSEPFSTFWSTGRAWGVYRQWKSENGQSEFEVEVLHGSVTGMTVFACGQERRM